jgi:DNA-binding transcriptional LysR family regulator
MSTVESFRNVGLGSPLDGSPHGGDPDLPHELHGNLPPVSGARSNRNGPGSEAPPHTARALRSLGRSLDDLQSMAVFARVVETGSFTAAARSLDSTTSAVSKRIARLEERLGVRLLERTTRALAPTEAGHVFHDRCARILRDVDEAELAVTEIGGSPRGNLRVTAVSVLGDGHMGPTLGAFAVAFPDLRVEVEFEDRKVNLIEEGFDVALRGMEIGASADSSMIARKLTTVERIVCASPAYLERRGVPATIDDLAHHDCLHYTPIPLHREWSFKTANGVRTPVVAPRLALNSVVALRGAAEAGAGLLRTGRLLVASSLQKGTLVPVLEDHVMVEFGLFAVYPAGKQALPKVKAFVDFLLRDLVPRLA